jgi:NADPH:quinone reductase-like Zn-dependent oxidoreductase
MYFAQSHRAVLEQLLKRAAEGMLSVGIDSRMPLSDAAEGLRRIKANDTTGKILLIP